MAGRRIKAFFVGCLLVALVQLPAAADDPKTSFRAETDGLPVSTQLGSWTVEDGTARLEMHGGHVVGDHTTFVATYRSPFVSKVEGEHSFEYWSALSGNGSITERFRTRMKGESWGRWFDFRVKLHDDGGFGGGFSSFGSSGASYQVEVRLVGTIKSQTMLDGYYEVTLPD